MSTVYKLVVATGVLSIIIYGIRRRYRRALGMQRLIVARMLPLMIISPLAVAFSERGLFASHKALLAMLGIVGVGIGVGLALYNGRRTQFEKRGKRVYYQSHPFIGYGLFGVLLVQLLIEVGIIFLGVRPHWHEITRQLHALPAASQQDPFTIVSTVLEYPALGHLHHIFDPLTRIIVGLLAGYYFVYHMYLLCDDNNR